MCVCLLYSVYLLIASQDQEYITLALRVTSGIHTPDYIMTVNNDNFATEPGMTHHKRQCTVTEH